MTGSRRQRRLVAQFALVALVVGMLLTAVGTAFADSEGTSEGPAAAAESTSTTVADPPSEDPQSVDTQSEDPGVTTTSTTAPAADPPADPPLAAQASSDGDVVALDPLPGCPNNNNGTYTCPLNPGNVGATNPGFSTVTPLSTCLNKLPLPAGPNNWAWHFVAPGNHNFISLTATFQIAGTFTNVLPVPGTNSAPDKSHLFLFTGPGDKLLSATAIVDADLPGGHFQLSHVCTGTAVEGTGFISVKKVIDPAGGAPDGAQFKMTIDCGTTPADTTYDQVITLTAPALGPVSSNAIPKGTNCTVTETSKPALSTLVSYDPNGGALTTPPTVEVGDNTTVAVTVTNSYPQSKISVKKVIDPAGATAPVGAQFEMTIDCDGTTHDEVITLTAPALGPVDSKSIPVGTKCTVTETKLPAAATLVSYDPNGGASTTPPTVTVLKDTTVAVTVTNAFAEVGGEFSGRVNIEKAVTGRPPAEGTKFVVNVKCTGPEVNVDQDVTLTYSTTLTGSVAFSAPSGGTITCTVTEKDPLGGAVSATIGPNKGVVVLTVNAPSQDVKVTNHYGDPVVQVAGVSVAGVSVTHALPFTGSSSDILLKSAAWLLGIGGAFWFIARKRRRGSGIAA
jgi:hypothetical protein